MFVSSGGRGNGNGGRDNKKDKEKGKGIAPSSSSKSKSNAKKESLTARRNRLYDEVMALQAELERQSRQVEELQRIYSADVTDRAAFVQVDYNHLSQAYDTLDRLQRDFDQRRSEYDSALAEPGSSSDESRHSRNSSGSGSSASVATTAVPGEAWDCGNCGTRNYHDPLPTIRTPENEWWGICRHCQHRYCDWAAHCMFILHPSPPLSDLGMD